MRKVRISPQSIFTLYCGDIGRSHNYLVWLQRSPLGMLVDLPVLQWLDTIPELHDIPYPQYLDTVSEN